MTKLPDDDYDRIMQDLRSRLDQIEQKPKRAENKPDYFWKVIAAGWLAAVVLCLLVIIFYS